MKDFDALSRQTEILEKMYPKFNNWGPRFYTAANHRLAMSHIDAKSYSISNYLSDFAEDVFGKVTEHYKNSKSLVKWIPSVRSESDGDTEGYRSSIRVLGQDVGMIIFDMTETKKGGNVSLSLDIDFLPYISSQESMEAITGILRNSVFEYRYNSNPEEFKERFPKIRNADKEKVIGHISSLKTRNREADEWLSENYSDIVKDVVMESVGATAEGKSEA